MFLNGNGKHNGNGHSVNGRLGQYPVAVKPAPVLPIPEVRRGPGAPKPPKYPKKGWDFPRRNVEIVPSEILYDPSRILGSYVYAKMRSTGETIVVQPRVETTALIQKQEINDCPYPSQLPVFKKQIHLDPSRDAEIFSLHGKIDVPAGGTALVASFSTFNNLRTFIKWMHYAVYDSLDPDQLTFQWLKDGVPLKIFACNPEITTSGGGYMPLVQSAVSTNTNCFPCLPEFQNALWEITDQHTIECYATDHSGIADRKVEVCAWGWIESITVWDEKVKR
jgi:hypothetical protein